MGPSLPPSVRELTLGSLRSSSFRSSTSIFVPQPCFFSRWAFGITGSGEEEDRWGELRWRERRFGAA